MATSITKPPVLEKEMFTSIGTVYVYRRGCDLRKWNITKWISKMTFKVVIEWHTLETSVQCLHWKARRWAANRWRAINVRKHTRWKRELTSAVTTSLLGGDQAMQQFMQSSHVPKQQRPVILMANHPSNPSLDLLDKPNAACGEFVFLLPIQSDCAGVFGHTGELCTRQKFYLSRNWKHLSTLKWRFKFVVFFVTVKWLFVSYKVKVSFFAHTPQTSPESH